MLIRKAFNPRLFSPPGQPITRATSSCVLALGVDDQSISIWKNTKDTPLVVFRDIFERQILDLCWYGVRREFCIPLTAIGRMTATRSTAARRTEQSALSTLTSPSCPTSPLLKRSMSCSIAFSMSPSIGRLSARHRSPLRHPSARCPPSAATRCQDRRQQSKSTSCRRVRRHQARSDG